MEENSCIGRVSFSIQNRYLNWKYHKDSERWDSREQHFKPNMRNKTSRNPALIWEGRGAFMWMNRPFPGLSCVQNLSYEDECDSHDTQPVSGTHFHSNRFARRLLFGKRPNTTRKWPTKFIKRNCVKKMTKMKNSLQIRGQICITYSPVDEWISEGARHLFDNILIRTYRLPSTEDKQQLKWTRCPQALASKIFTINILLTKYQRSNLRLHQKIANE